MPRSEIVPVIKPYRIGILLCSPSRSHNNSIDCQRNPRTCCCCYEYRGDCSCSLFPKRSKALGLNRGTAGWAFDEKSNDVVKIEFEFFDMTQETARIKANGKYTMRPERIRLNLETNRENVDAVHEKARRFVSLLSAPFSNVVAAYEEGKEEADLRKQLSTALTIQAAAASAALGLAAAGGGSAATKK